MAKKRMSGFRLYLRYVRLAAKAGVQYKGWFFMVIQTAFVTVTDPLGTIFLFARFGSIGPWSMERILLVYALAITGFGLAETFGRGFDYFPFHMVRGGGFDRIMLRPRSTFVQICAWVFHLHRLARVASGLAAIVWCLRRLEVPSRLFAGVMAGYALAGGLLFYLGVFVLTSGVAFFTVEATGWIFVFTNVSYQITRCPVDYMPGALRKAFTFLVPVLVVSYYPASVMCGWGEPLWKGLLALPVGLAFLGASLLVWRLGIRHYKSTGS